MEHSNANVINSLFLLSSAVPVVETVEDFVEGLTPAGRALPPALTLSEGAFYIDFDTFLMSDQKGAHAKAACRDAQICICFCIFKYICPSVTRGKR